MLTPRHILNEAHLTRAYNISLLTHDYNTSHLTDAHTLVSYILNDTHETHGLRIPRHELYNSHLTHGLLIPRHDSLTPRHDSLTPRHDLLTPRHDSLSYDVVRVMTWYKQSISRSSTARSREDETRNGRRNANRNPDWSEHFGKSHHRSLFKVLF